MTYELTKRERDLLRGNGEDARLFREGARCEANIRRGDIPKHHQQMVSYINTLSRCHPEKTALEILHDALYVFTPKRPWWKPWGKRD